MINFINFLPFFRIMTRRKTEKKTGGLERLIHGAHAIDHAKQVLEPGLDELLLFGAANTAAVYQITSFLDGSNLSDLTGKMAMLGTGAVLLKANQVILNSPRTEPLREYATRLNRWLDSKRPLSWLKTAALATTLVWSVNGLQPYTAQMYDDLSARLRQTQEQEMRTPEIGMRTPEVGTIGTRRALYDALGYSKLVEHDFSGIRLADKDSMIGRVQRTKRWEPIYHAVEEAYGIPKDTLGGMIMQESYGDPVQPNATNDGGLGVVHVQGTTAKLRGLNIYGDSRRDSDQSHGKEIRQMLSGCKYDPACVQKYDERAHLIKVLDTAGRIVSEGKRIHGTWDEGVEFYRAPGKVGRNTTWKYLQMVKKWRAGLQDEQAFRRAEVDFQTRNESSLDDYLQKWRQMSNNWGLPAYQRFAQGRR
jgi:hypothetical protein